MAFLISSKLYSMIPVKINNLTYFFSVVHITNESPTNLIYGINLNRSTYYLCKTLEINDCKQIDSHPLLDPLLLNELCAVITEIETVYKRRPSLEYINREIFSILGRIRSPLFKLVKVPA